MATKVQLVEFCFERLCGEFPIQRLECIESHTPFEQTEMTLRWGLADDGVNDGVNDGVILTKPQQELLTALTNTPAATAAELASELGKSPRTIERTLKTLKDKGIIHRHGADKNGYWEVKK